MPSSSVRSSASSHSRQSTSTSHTHSTSHSSRHSSRHRSHHHGGHHHRSSPSSHHHDTRGASWSSSSLAMHHQHKGAFSVVRVLADDSETTKPSSKSVSFSVGMEEPQGLAEDRRRERLSMYDERSALLLEEAPRVLQLVYDQLKSVSRDLSPAAVPAHDRTHGGESAGTQAGQELKRTMATSPVREDAASGPAPAPKTGRKGRRRPVAIGGSRSTRSAVLSLSEKLHKAPAGDKDSVGDALDGAGAGDDGKNETRAEKKGEHGLEPQFYEFSSANGLLSGKLRCEGVSIAGCEVVVRSEESSQSSYHWRKGAAVETRIGPPTLSLIAPKKSKRSERSNGPLINMPQIKSAFQYTRLAVAVVDELLDLCARIRSGELLQESRFHHQSSHDGDPSLRKSNVDDACVNAVATLLADASQYLQLTMQAFLVQPRSHAFPEGSDETAQRYFSPPLPRDLVLELSLQRRHVVVTAYCLQLLRPQDVDKATLRDSGIGVRDNLLGSANTLEFSPVGRTLLWACCGGDAQHVEVVDYGVAEIPVDAISETFSQVAAVYAACSSLQEKLNTFR